MKKVICALLCLLTLGATAFAAESVFVLPSTLLRIGGQAFYGDSAMERVVLPDGLEHIGSQAFAFSAVKRVNLPETLTYIADDAFEGCSLEKVDAKGDYAIHWCQTHGIPLTTDPDEGDPIRP